MDGHTYPDICLTVLVSLSLFPNDILGQKGFDFGGIGTYDRLEIAELHISSHVESRFATVDVFSRMVKLLQHRHASGVRCSDSRNGLHNQFLHGH